MPSEEFRELCRVEGPPPISQATVWPGGNLVGKTFSFPLSHCPTDIPAARSSRTSCTSSGQYRAARFLESRIASPTAGLRALPTTATTSRSTRRCREVCERWRLLLIASMYAACADYNGSGARVENIVKLRFMIVSRSFVHEVFGPEVSASILHPLEVRDSDHHQRWRMSNDEQRPFSSRMETAAAVVGPLAPSQIIRALISAAFRVVMTFSSAAAAARRHREFSSRPLCRSPLL